MKLGTDLTDAKLQLIRTEEIMRLLKESIGYPEVKMFHRPITPSVAPNIPSLFRSAENLEAGEDRHQQV